MPGSEEQVSPNTGVQRGAETSYSRLNRNEYCLGPENPSLYLLLFFLLTFLLLHLCRFLFILLGPSGRAKSYNEIGRAIATLMVDDVSGDEKRALPNVTASASGAVLSPIHSSAGTHEHLLCARLLAECEDYENEDPLGVPTEWGRQTPAGSSG